MPENNDSTFALFHNTANLIIMNYNFLQNVGVPQLQILIVVSVIWYINIQKANQNCSGNFCLKRSRQNYLIV